MGIRISFELSDEDLDHFRMIMKQASKTASSRSEQGIIQAAESLMKEVSGSKAPEFVRDRLGKLKIMTGMLRDSEWQLPDEETGRVLSALAYFGESEDLIPDHIPGLGFLDDAIMIELVVRELKHEIEAYEDFCAFREREEAKRGSGEDQVTRDAWMADRRMELHSRMRRRRTGGRSRKSGRSGIRSGFSLF